MTAPVLFAARGQIGAIVRAVRADEIANRWRTRRRVCVVEVFHEDFLRVNVRGQLLEGSQSPERFRLSISKGEGDVFRHSSM